MPPIARRNLFHDRIKLALALTGIVFSVVLVTLQLGLYIGAMHNSSGVVDNAGVDVWIMQPGTRNVDMCDSMDDRRYYQAITTPGVAWAEKLIVQFSLWKLPDGRQESVEVVGLQPNSRLNLPWGMAVGKRKHVFQVPGLIIDERERSRFGRNGHLLPVGERTEIYGHRAKVLGFCRGVGTFTTAPYVFTSFKNALDYSLMKQGQTKYVVLKAKPDVTPEELQQRLRARMSGVDIYTTKEFSTATRHYWLHGTGMGLGVIVATLLGLIVGVVIVGQTMYSATIERLQEYGTLKALGMGNLTLTGIIIRQALIAGLLGYAVGSCIAFAVGRKLPEFNVPVEVPIWLVGGMFFITVGICVIASVTSIIRVFRLEPAIVFRS